MRKNLKKDDITDDISIKNIEKVNDNHMTWHQVIWYLLIFSVIGLIVETLFGYFTTGILESRKGLILGPYCPIYGLGAVIIIFILNRYKGHWFKLFVYGGILGDFIEYLLSYALEAIYGSRFWNYTNAFNVNGRICLLYTFFWGVLSVLLVNCIKGLIDKFVNKISGKPRKITDIILTIFFIIDILFTVWATSVYKARAKEVYYDVSVFNEPSLLRKVGDKIFSDDIMVKIFPNLRFIDNNGSEIWIRDVIKK